MPRKAVSWLNRTVTKIPYGELPGRLRYRVRRWHDKISTAPIDTYDRLPAYQRGYWQYLAKIAAKEISPSTPFQSKVERHARRTPPIREGV